jgi:hypothetical protein
MANTHYAVIAFSGDPAGEHSDEDLRNEPPGLQLIACGPEGFCWSSLTAWIERNPLREWETAEVLQRDPVLAADGERGLAAWASLPVGRSDG